MPILSGPGATPWDGLPDLESGVDGAAQAIVRDYCGWHIAPSITQVVELDGTGSSRLLLPTLFATAVSGVTEDGVALTDDGYHPYRGWALDRWAPGSARRLPQLWGGVVQLSLTHGYPQCPPQVRAVVARVAKDLATPARTLSVRVDDTSVTYAPGEGAIDEYCAAILAPFRLAPRS